MRATWITLAVLIVAVIAFGVYMLSVNPIGETSAEGAELPKAVVTEKMFDFGIMDQNEKGHHEFKIANEGAGPLKLTKGAVSCKCVAAVLDDEVPPGGTGTFRMEWTTLSSPDLTFSHTAAVRTNDPGLAEVHFRIVGRVRPAFQLDPISLGFPDVHHGHRSRAQALEVWAPDKGFKITRWEQAENLDVKVVPMPPERLKELKAEAGYMVAVSVLSTHPTGRLDNRAIRFHTNHRTRKTFDVPLRGFVVGQLSFEPRRAAFQYVDGSQGKAVDIYVYFRGKGQVAFAVADIKPSFLKVDEPRRAKDDSSRYIVTIRVPQNAPAGPFEGEVKLQTDNKDTPELVIPVTGTVLSGS